MKTIICYPEALADNHDIKLSSWIISNYLEHLGYEVFYDEVPSGSDVDLECYYDQLALYCLEDCVTPSLLRKIVLSRHILHAYSTKKDKFPPVPNKLQHKLNIVYKKDVTLPKLVWNSLHKSKYPAAFNKPINYAQFLHHVKPQ